MLSSRDGVSQGKCVDESWLGYCKSTTLPADTTTPIPGDSLQCTQPVRTQTRVFLTRRSLRVQYIIGLKFWHIL